MPYEKYRNPLGLQQIPLTSRQWPSRQLTKAPRWLSTDLRDGNQSLITPMSPDQKLLLFNELVACGFKEIEVGFPSASDNDVRFIRTLIDRALVPDDVTISVLTQAREDLINQTVDCLHGLPQATIHVYNAISPQFRRMVFGMSKDNVCDLAVNATQMIAARVAKVLDPSMAVGLEYSPELVVDAEPEFALRICSEVARTWRRSQEGELIINLPATVERTTPNVFADYVEWISTNLADRDSLCLSVHPHNDRGCAVAAAELAMLAGADRIEGCLFGHGERTGNVDLVTLALNLLSQGINPELDFSAIDRVRSVVEECTSIEVPARAPYAGDLVYTSFSGSHQDAIRKGFADRAREVQANGGRDASVPWTVPYLPIDPHDVGRTYEAVVRVNAQSGKAGVAFLLHRYAHIDIPRRLQVEFSRVVQRYADSHLGELDAAEVWSLFVDEYMPSHQGLNAHLPGLIPADGGRMAQPWGRYRLVNTMTSSRNDGALWWVDAVLADAECAREASQVPSSRAVLDGDHVINDQATASEISQELGCVRTRATGDGPLEAFIASLEFIGWNIRVLDYSEHALGQGRDAHAAAYVECEIGGETWWGVGIDKSITTASFAAVISALNRSVRGEHDPIVMVHSSRPEQGFLP
ncbi:2-isopropylmalate synthase [Actinomyces vulturis]|uniref:2-isopropylmalate synthase n=1 Tax=Actinomyces vulturis TaxID=1857645 RepID=UPI000B5AD99E|nr:2-isopropylmalate synthase [Actinomyces vulturis]